MEPADGVGQCNAHLYLADNYGDNHTTIRCQLAPAHPGLHQEQFTHDGHSITITWEYDERPAREAEDAVLRGMADAGFAGIPEEAGEPYLAGFNDELLDREADE